MGRSLGCTRSSNKVIKKIRAQVFQPLEYLNIQGKKVGIFKNVSKGSPLTYFFNFLSSDLKLHITCDIACPNLTKVLSRQPWGYPWWGW